ncbi:MAG: LEA type 2 family protein [candidate division KSB1 bacterium]|nr:LEA type 2 family protein [candidate division KSB1 bacterium]
MSKSISARRFALWRHSREAVRFAALTFLAGGLVGGCAALKTMGIKEPTATVRGVRLTSLSFDQVGLTVQVAVQNPNAVSVSLAGYDYELKMGDVPLLSGLQEQAVAIQRKAESVVDIPVTLRFAELFEKLQTVAQQDSADLGLAANLWVDLPVLGRTKLPIKAHHRVPVLKLPALSIEGIRAKMVGLTSAEIGLQVRVHNPNSLGFNISRLSYALTLHDKVPANGLLQNLQLPAHGAAEFTLPVTVDVVKVGQALFSTLTSKQPLKYDLKADVVMGTGLDLLREASLHLTHSGQITP